MVIFYLIIYLNNVKSFNVEKNQPKKRELTIEEKKSYIFKVSSPVPKYFIFDVAMARGAGQTGLAGTLHRDIISLSQP